MSIIIVRFHVFAILFYFNDPFNVGIHCYFWYLLVVLIVIDLLEIYCDRTFFYFKAMFSNTLK